MVCLVVLFYAHVILSTTTNFQFIKKLFFRPLRTLSNIHLSCKEKLHNRMNMTNPVLFPAAKNQWMGKGWKSPEYGGCRCLADYVCVVFLV